MKLLINEEKNNIQICKKYILSGINHTAQQSVFHTFSKFTMSIINDLQRRCQ